MVVGEVGAYGQYLSARLRASLGDQLVGAYFVGSIAMGGYVPGESDIDIIAVSEHHAPEWLKDDLAEALLDPALACPARGLEFNMYRREVAASPPAGADFELSVNGGPRMARMVRFDPQGQPGFWYAIDRAIAHRFGMQIVGPTPGEVFFDISRQTLLAAMSDSMRWHREHEGATLYSVLNASRAWRFAAEDILGSKLEGAEWARTRWPSPENASGRCTGAIATSGSTSTSWHQPVRMSMTAERNRLRRHRDLLGLAVLCALQYCLCLTQ